MIWPENLLNSPPEVRLEADYELRLCGPAEEAAWPALMARAGFAGWDGERLEAFRARILPEGWFVAVHRASGQMVATAMAVDGPGPLHPEGGELSWVAGDPDHAGHGLGRAVSSAAVARLLAAGYRRVYLSTDDWRLPAIKIYLSMGFVPLLYAEDMAERWEKVYAALGLPLG
jgi:mycothiol synthase